jgi:hypothetical protein
MEASISFDRDDVSLLKEPACLPDRVFTLYTLTIVSREVGSWTTFTARYCLGMNSLLQNSHIEKSFTVVLSLSYGSSLITVYLGPQFVHVMKK